MTAGADVTFTQNIAQLDNDTKRLNVLGEVCKNFVVTPDIDRLLGELFIAGGITPGDIRQAAEKRSREPQSMKEELQ